MVGVVAGDGLQAEVNEQDYLLQGYKEQNKLILPIVFVQKVETTSEIIHSIMNEGAGRYPEKEEVGQELMKSQSCYTIPPCKENRSRKI